MNDNKDEFSISAQCGTFGVSRSGYYAWRNRQDHPSQRQLARKRLDFLVAEAFEARKGRSGAMVITLDLDEQRHAYNRKTVAASMKRQGLVAKAGKKYKATTDSDHDLPVAPNRLAQDFSADAPNQKWVCDITYLWTGEGWSYLAVVLDLFSRMVVGWAMDKRMEAKLVRYALQMALWRRRMLGPMMSILTSSKVKTMSSGGLGGWSRTTPAAQPPSPGAILLALTKPRA